MRAGLLRPAGRRAWALAVRRPAAVALEARRPAGGLRVGAPTEAAIASSRQRTDASLGLRVPRRRQDRCLHGVLADSIEIASLPVRASACGANASTARGLALEWLREGSAGRCGYPACSGCMSAGAEPWDAGRGGIARILIPPGALARRDSPRTNAAGGASRRPARTNSRRLDDPTRRTCRSSALWPSA